MIDAELTTPLQRLTDPQRQIIAENLKQIMAP